MGGRISAYAWTHIRIAERWDVGDTILIDQTCLVTVHGISCNTWTWHARTSTHEISFLFGNFNLIFFYLIISVHPYRYRARVDIRSIRNRGPLIPLFLSMAPPLVGVDNYLWQLSLWLTSQNAYQAALLGSVCFYVQKVILKKLWLSVRFLDRKMDILKTRRKRTLFHRLLD